jgi:hypothetical protein
LPKISGGISTVINPANNQHRNQSGQYEPYQKPPGQIFPEITDGESHPGGKFLPEGMMAPMFFRRAVLSVTAAVHRAPQIRDNFACWVARAKKIFGDPRNRSGNKGNHRTGNRHDRIQQCVGYGNGINTGFRC